MAARSIGSATISFGLVSIPIKLYSASQPNAGVGFNLLHGECGSRIKQQYVCPRCERTVERKELVRGYEFSKDQFVTFTDDELKAMEAQASRAVDIERFVPLSAVDPLYFDRAYYLGPDRGAEKAYRLLGDAMRAAAQVAVAKYVLHGKEHLVVLRATEHGLVLHTAFFADEVRDQREVDQGGAVAVREGEMALARKLIDELSAERFEPEKYEDEYRTRVLEAVEAKVAGQQVTAAPVETGRAQVIDLMEALKQSLAERGGAEGAAGRRPARTRRPAVAARARKGSRK